MFMDELTTKPHCSLNKDMDLKRNKWGLTVKKEVPITCVAMSAVEDGHSRNDTTLDFSTLLIRSVGFPPKDILILFLHFPS